MKREHLRLPPPKLRAAGAPMIEPNSFSFPFSLMGPRSSLNTLLVFMKLFFLLASSALFFLIVSAIIKSHSRQEGEVDN